jgi:hypothetical protein
MKFWKHILITTLVFVSICSSVLFTACKATDSCDDLKCINGGTCSNNFCKCPSTFDGPQCENKIGDRFVGNYIGSMTAEGYPTIADTIYIRYKNDPDKLWVSYSYSYGNTTKRDTVIGTINGGVSINIPAYNNGNYRKTYALNLNSEINRLSFAIVETADVTNASSTVIHYNFLGFKL